MLRDELRGKASMAITWHGDLNIAEFAGDGLYRLAVTHVTKGLGDRRVFVVSQMHCHLGTQGGLKHRLGQLLEETVFADDVGGLLVSGNKLVDQFLASRG